MNGEVMAQLDHRQQAWALLGISENKAFSLTDRLAALSQVHEYILEQLAEIDHKIETFGDWQVKHVNDHINDELTSHE